MKVFDRKKNPKNFDFSGGGQSKETPPYDIMWGTKDWRLGTRHQGRKTKDQGPEAKDHGPSDQDRHWRAPSRRSVFSRGSAPDFIKRD